jgi:hypothetical protein
VALTRRPGGRAIVQRGDLRARVRLLADEQDVRTVTRLLNRAVLAGVGGVVGLLSVLLLGTQGGPPFTGDTSLFQFFGLLRPVLRHRPDPAGGRRDPARRPQLKGQAPSTAATARPSR